MPTSREQAQRYAEASRRKKRRVGGPRVVLQKVAAEVVLVEEDETTEVRPETVARVRRSATFQPRVQRTRAAFRRPFSEYRDDYAYVTRDLRRVVIVSGLLFVVLIALYFVLR